MRLRLSGKIFYRTENTELLIYHPMRIYFHASVHSVSLCELKDKFFNSLRLCVK